MKIAPLVAWIAITTIGLLILSAACRATPTDEQYVQTASAHNLMKQQTATANATRTAKRELQEETRRAPKPTSTPVSNLDVIAMQMAVISGEDNSVTRQRFKFFIPRFVEICPEMPNSDRASNHLVIAYEELERAGLSGEEGLVDVSNNLYRIVVDIDTFASSNDIPMPRCIELFAFYTTLRLEGWSAQEAREGVVDVTVGIYSISQ